MNETDNGDKDNGQWRVSHLVPLTALVGGFVYITAVALWFYGQQIEQRDRITRNDGRIDALERLTRDLDDKGTRALGRTDLRVNYLEQAQMNLMHRLDGDESVIITIPVMSDRITAIMNQLREMNSKLDRITASPTP